MTWCALMGVLYSVLAVASFTAVSPKSPSSSHSACVVSDETLLFVCLFGIYMTQPKTKVKKVWSRGRSNGSCWLRVKPAIMKENKTKRAMYGWMDSASKTKTQLAHTHSASFCSATHSPQSTLAGGPLGQRYGGPPIPLPRYRGEPACYCCRC